MHLCNLGDHLMTPERAAGEHDAAVAGHPHQAQRPEPERRDTGEAPLLQHQHRIKVARSIYRIVKHVLASKFRVVYLICMCFLHAFFGMLYSWFRSYFLLSPFSSSAASIVIVFLLLLFFFFRTRTPPLLLLETSSCLFFVLLTTLPAPPPQGRTSSSKRPLAYFSCC